VTASIAANATFLTARVRREGMRTLAFASLLLAALTLAGCADDPETQSTDPDGTTTPLPWTPPPDGNTTTGTNGTSTGTTTATMTTTYPA
jgi:hypothetical protein